LFSKERVHTIIINGRAKAYKNAFFKSRRIVADSFQNENFVIIGDEKAGFVASFYEKFIDDEKLKFTPISEGTATIMSDQFDNRYNIFGQAISGPNEGIWLRSTGGVMGFWFAWAAFYPEIEIY
jgi:hypothetical protein